MKYEIVLSKKDTKITASTTYGGVEWKKSFVITEDENKNKNLKQAIINACHAKISVEECKRLNTDQLDTEIWKKVKNSLEIVDNSNI